QMCQGPVQVLEGGPVLDLVVAQDLFDVRAHRGLERREGLGGGRQGVGIPRPSEVESRDVGRAGDLFLGRDRGGGGGPWEYREKGDQDGGQKMLGSRNRHGLYLRPRSSSSSAPRRPG